MASRKMYLYGLGTGLIAAAITLQLAGIGQSAQEQIAQGGRAPQSWSDEELREAAAEHGYKLYDAGETWYSSRDLEAKIAEAVQAGREEAEPTRKIYAFTIASGTQLSTIARLLFDLGLVDDPNHFISIMEDRNLAGNVQAKYYRFDEVPTLEELIAELTSM